jgi:hypothetical protein
MNKNTAYIIIIAILVALGGYLLFKPSAQVPQGFNSSALPANGLVGDTTAERAAHPDNPNAQPVPNLSEQVTPPAPAGMPAAPAIPPTAAIPPMPTAPAPAPYDHANDPLASMGPRDTGPITAGVPPATALAPQAPQKIPGNVTVVVPYRDHAGPADDVPPVTPVPAPASTMPISPGEGQ